MYTLSQSCQYLPHVAVGGPLPDLARTMWMYSSSEAAHAAASSVVKRSYLRLRVVDFNLLEWPPGGRVSEVICLSRDVQHLELPQRYPLLNPQQPGIRHLIEGAVHEQPH